MVTYNFNLIYIEILDFKHSKFFIFGSTIKVSDQMGQSKVHWICQMGQSKVQLGRSNMSVKGLTLPNTLPNLNGLGSNNPNDPI